MKQFILVRHGIALDRDEAAKSNVPDADRPLTKVGHSKMQGAALGLHAIAPDIDVLATSPWRRARETADIIAAQQNHLDVRECPALIPGHHPGELLDWLRDVAEARCIALVGHEPDMSSLAGWLLAGELASFIVFKKGGACLIEFPGHPDAGLGMLRWCLTPAQLRGLGGAR